MSVGKQASGSEAAAPMAAGARLEAMRRRVRLSRLAVWSVVAAGPVALGIAIASTPAKPTAVRERRDAFPQWVHTYSHHRGHTALTGKPPASRVHNLTGQYS